MTGSPWPGSTRLAILDAARDLLLCDGYRATTVKGVAQRADVSAETIYKTFGTKPRLMKAVYDVTLAGDDDEVPVGQRPVIRTIRGTPGRYPKIDLYSGFVTDLMERLGGLLAVLAEADQELAEIRATADDERLTGVGAFVRHLADEGHLAVESVPHATDAAWVLTSPTLYAQLVHARRWPPARYRQWLATMLSAALPEPPAAVDGHPVTVAAT